jgi:hypothetical protein
MLIKPGASDYRASKPPRTDSARAWECILLRDAGEDLQRQRKIVKKMMDAYDRVEIGAGQPEPAIDSHRFQKAINEQAWEKVGYITVLAKSKMLDDFGEQEVASALLMPYVLQSPNERLRQVY